LVFGMVGMLTGSSRFGIAALVVFFVAGGILLMRVDEEKGFKDAAVVEG